MEKNGKTNGNGKENQGEEMLHCKGCWSYRRHYRRVSGGMEIFKCVKCGTEQSYKLRETAEVEE